MIGFIRCFVFAALVFASAGVGEPTRPELIFKAQPAYPEAARAAGIQGNVLISMVVDDHGLVSEVEVLGEAPQELAEAARQAVIGWRFEPARLDGEPVSVAYRVTVAFKLDDGDKIVSADDDGIVAPTKISGPQPSYPEAARSGKIQGRVVLQTVIAKDGTVRRVQVLEGMAGGLTEAAVRAVEDWRFEPATQNGKAVEVRYVLTVAFRLE